MKSQTNPRWWKWHNPGMAKCCTTTSVRKYFKEDHEWWMRILYNGSQRLNKLSMWGMFALPPTHPPLSLCKHQFAGFGRSVAVTTRWEVWWLLEKGVGCSGTEEKEWGGSLQRCSPWKKSNRVAIPLFLIQSTYAEGGDIREREQEWENGRSWMICWCDHGIPCRRPHAASI